MTEPHILVLGASAIDTKGRASGPMLAGEPNPGDIRVSGGGVARNIAENLGRLGLPTVLLSCVGDDDAGKHVLRQTEEGGVDMGSVLVSSDHSTGAYLAVMDADGALQLSISSMEATEELTPRFLYDRRRWFRDASILVMDGNLLPSSLSTVFKMARHYELPVCLDPTSPALAERFVPYLEDLYLVTPNPAEASVLCGQPVLPRRSDAIKAAKCLVGRGVEIAVITLGEFGACYATSEVSGHVPALRCGVVDLTGAGDAMTAGVLFGLLEELPVDEAVRLGVAAATLAVQTRETVCKNLSLERLYDQLAA
jgi:pseudouridine kinase